MSLTLEALEKRLAALETEVAVLRGIVHRDETAAESGEWAWRLSKAQQAEMQSTIEKLFRLLGIPNSPGMTIEQLHQSMIDHGADPQDNSASQELIRMRDE